MLKNLKSKLTRKSSKFMFTEINKTGFSKVWINLNKKYIFSPKLLEKAINRLFKKFRKGRSYFLIGKIKFVDNSIKSIHKGTLSLAYKYEENGYCSK